MSWSTYRGEYKKAAILRTTFSCHFLVKNTGVFLYNDLALIRVMTWCRTGDMPLSEPIPRLLTHICVTQLQRINQHTWDGSMHIVGSTLTSLHLVFQHWRSLLICSSTQNKYWNGQALTANVDDVFHVVYMLFDHYILKNVLLLL